jgi:Ca-activated chloride channel family protein
MSFVWPTLLWLAPALLLVALLAWRIAARRRNRTAASFVDPHLLTQVVHTASPRRIRWTRGLQLASLALLLVAAARPLADPPLPVNKAAVVIALDASRSMLADDADPNRLEFARAIAKEFVEQVPASTLIGVASFSDSASLLVPPTLARDEVLEALDRVEPARNTSLADAVVAGVRMLPEREDSMPAEPLGTVGPQDAFGSPRGEDTQAPVATEPLPPGRILVISDGVSNVSSTPGLPAEVALDLALEFAEEQEVEIYTLPVGNEGGTVTTIEGRAYFVPFDGRTLELVAERTGGGYLSTGDREELREVFRELGRQIRWERTEMEVSALLSGFAALLLLVAGWLGLLATRTVP